MAKSGLIFALLVTILAGCSLPRLPGRPAKPVAPVEQEPLATTRFELNDPPVGVVGQIQTIRTREKDTFIDIAQAYHLGYDELVEANPGIDPWLPGEGTRVVLPSRFVLPDAPRQGLVLNVASKRLFYFPPTPAGAQALVYTFPISIGREGWATPLGTTKVVSKKKDPVWRVPASVRKEHAENGDPLPAIVPPGPDNPLGHYAMRLAIPGDYLIHGTNKPAGIGMRMSHGCIRMNPDDIEWLFDEVPVGMPVHIINQPVLLGARDGEWYLEAHAGLEEERNKQSEWLLREVEKVLRKTTTPTTAVDHDRIARVIEDRRGFPVSIMTRGLDYDAAVQAAPQVTNIVTYDWFADKEADDAASEPSPGGGDARSAPSK